LIHPAYVVSFIDYQCVYDLLTKESTKYG
jgi:hypothetical protein